MTANIISVAKEALVTEKFAAAVYKHLALKYKDNQGGKAFLEVSEMEKGHVLFWSDFLKKRSVDTTHLRHSNVRFILHKLLLRIIGKALTLRIMETGENQAIELYSSLLEGNSLSEKEEDIAKVIGDELPTRT
jgi:rubrerythrin